MKKFEIIGELCYFEHRTVGSENERAAARLVLERMRDLGLEASLEEFRAPASITLEIVSLISFFPGAIAASLFLPWIGVLACSLSIILFWGYFTHRFRPLAPFFRDTTSVNVVGRSVNDSAEKRIIFTAHHDTARSGPLWNPKRVAGFRSTFVLGALLLVVIEALLILHAVGASSNLSKYMLFGLSLYVFGQIAVLIWGYLRGALVNGANDNASGVAVVLDLASRLRVEDFPKMEFWFVSTGSEESGLAGMDAFMDRHGDGLPRDSTFFINVDSVGQGELHYFTGEGMLNITSFSERLVEAATEAVESSKLQGVTPRVFRLGQTDAIVPANRGYHTILLAATDERGIVPDWHWETDIRERLDYDLIGKTSDFAFEMVLKLGCAHV